MERGGAGRRSGLGADRGNAGEAETIGDLRGEIGAILELLAVHDADLHRFEGADRRVLERAVVGFGEEIEDGGEDAAGEVHLGETDRRDVDLPRHRRVA